MNLEKGVLEREIERNYVRKRVLEGEIQQRFLQIKRNPRAISSALYAIDALSNEHGCGRRSPQRLHQRPTHTERRHYNKRL